ncbi:efflux RND transporter periplasmic adaptor subunit [Sphingomicrobium astaxanthinifaciens]|uniref:efflux RND transporter periplasmic adaptor subunit n=1 Tax=Sphingomicrobium astaxanthinifaciens TaxID=1227949 RepID=UPI001FCCAF84|nr:efflux RND transporter periplasmic adaptor subunit [Sphingomicrobium astaxanthinifaciens]MCJ7420838.1 efflux RND transporter periplasmic adaptor subunit [Sphingomicrobium astaxanthinifaciens]
MNRELALDDGLAVADQARHRRKRRAFLIGGLIVLAVLLAAYFAFSSGEEEGATGPRAAGAAGGGQAPSVSVIVPGTSEIGRTIIAAGTLAARRDQAVGVAGSGRVTRVLAEAGNWVRQGQLLASIERSVQTQTAQQQRAQIAAAQADADLAKSELERAQALVERGFVSQADIDRKQAAYDAARARVAVAQAQLNQTRASIGLLDIRAPTAGLILERNIEVGQVVSPGTPYAFRMARGGEMEMRARLSQEDLSAVSVGMPALIVPTGTDTQFDGRVWQVSPVIDPQSRQGEVRIAIPYDPAIRPGGFAEARIGAGATTAPLLPQSAVLADARGNFVYIVNADNEVVRRDVTVASVDDRGVTIASGIDGTEQVVSRAGSFLTEGRKVSPVRESAR